MPTRPDSSDSTWSRGPDKHPVAYRAPQRKRKTMSEAITAFGNLPFPHALLLTLAVLSLLLIGVSLIAAAVRR